MDVVGIGAAQRPRIERRRWLSSTPMTRQLAGPPWRGDNRRKVREYGRYRSETMCWTARRANSRRRSSWRHDPQGVPRHDRGLGNHSGRRTGEAALSPDASALEAGRADRRQVPPHRHSDQQLPARRFAAHRRPDAVQLRVAQPAHQPDLPARSLLARLRRDSRRRPDAREHELVPGHGRRRAARDAAFPVDRSRLLS